MSWAEVSRQLLALQREGVYGPEVVAVCRYAPAGRTKTYWKIVVRGERGRLEHRHIRQSDLKGVLERWERTKLYRKLVDKHKEFFFMNLLG